MRQPDAMERLSFGSISGALADFNAPPLDLRVPGIDFPLLGSWGRGKGEVEGPTESTQEDGTVAVAGGQGNHTNTTLSEVGAEAESEARAELERSRAALAKVMAAKDASVARTAELQEQLDTRKTCFGQTEQLESKIARLEAELAAEREKVEDKSTELSSKTVQVVESSEEAARLAAEKAALQGELNAVRVQMEGKTSEGEESSAEAKRLRSEIARLEAELAAEREKVEDNSSDLAKFLEEAARLAADKEALQGDLAAMLTQMEGKTAEVARCSEEATRLAQDVVRLEDELVEMRALSKAGHVESNELRAHVAEREADLAKFKEVIQYVDMFVIWICHIP